MLVTKLCLCILNMTLGLTVTVGYLLNQWLNFLAWHPVRFRHSSNGALAFCRGPALDSLPCSQYVSPQGMPGPKEKSLNPKKFKPFQTNGSLHTLSVYDSTRSVASPWWSVPPWNCLPQYPSFPQDVKEKNHVDTYLGDILNTAGWIYKIFMICSNQWYALTLCWPIMHTHTHLMDTILAFNKPTDE